MLGVRPEVTGDPHVQLCHADISAMAYSDGGMGLQS